MCKIFNLSVYIVVKSSAKCEKYVYLQKIIKL